MLIGISWREWRHDWRMSLCLVSITAAIAVPLLLLLTLRSGMIEEVRQELTSSLVARELQARRQSPFTASEVEQIKALPGVEHVEPQLRYLALGALVEIGDLRESADMIAITPGNPLPVAAGGKVDLAKVIASTALATQLQLSAGDQVTLQIDVRAADGTVKEQGVPFVVSAVLPREFEPRSALLVDAMWVQAADRFRLSGGEVAISEALRSVRGRSQKSRAASLRVFAESIDWVDPVRGELSNRGASVDGKIAEIRLLGRLDTGLTMLVGLLGLVMLLGLGLSNVATQAAWINRKRLELGYLKLIGFGTNRLVWILMLQSLFTALAGIALALCLGWAIAWIARDVLSQISQFDPALLTLRASDIAAVAALIVLISLLSAASLTFAARQLQPADALRERL